MCVFRAQSEKSKTLENLALAILKLPLGGEHNLAQGFFFTMKAQTDEKLTEPHLTRLIYTFFGKLQTTRRA